MRFDLLASLLARDFLPVVRAILTWPKFSASSYAMLSSLSKQGIRPATVLDVGANTGQFAVAAARLFPECHVHAFEPVPDCYDDLVRTTRRLGNVSTHAVGLGDRDGELPITVNAHRHSSSFLRLSETHRSSFPFAREEESVSVPVRTLDSFLDSLSCTEPVLLKLDVQGFEKNVLLGAGETLGHVEFIILEASLRPMYEGELLFGEMVTFLDTLGFRFLRPIGWLPDPATGEFLQMDCLFQRTVAGDAPATDGGAATP